VYRGVVLNASHQEAVNLLPLGKEPRLLEQSGVIQAERVCFCGDQRLFKCARLDPLLEDKVVHAFQNVIRFLLICISDLWLQRLLSLPVLLKKGLLELFELVIRLLLLFQRVCFFLTREP
jgi:hypothetical protein